MDAPRISDPPRRVPLGVKLALFDHREITTSLNWSLPAAVCLLLSAIAQPLRGARIALVLVGTVCLILSMRRSVPRISKALDTIKRMRYGRLTLGRIVECGMGWGPLRGRRPFAEFLKKWDAVDDYTYPRYMFGCLFTFFGLLFVLPMGAFLVLFGLALVMKALNVPGVTFEGDFSFSYFLQALGMTILAVIMFFVVRFIMIIYLMVKGDQIANERLAPQDQVSVAASLERELREAFSMQLPKPEKAKPFPDDNLDWKLNCKVEYPGAGKAQVAKATARFSYRLNRSGIEPLLFHPAIPAEVDLLQALPPQVILSGGNWIELPVARPAVMLAITALVYLTALTALAYEALSLAMGSAA